MQIHLKAIGHYQKVQEAAEKSNPSQDTGPAGKGTGDSKEAVESSQQGSTVAGEDSGELFCTVCNIKFNSIQVRNGALLGLLGFLCDNSVFCLYSASKCRCT